MIVAMRTKAQAQRVAELTGGKIILKDNKPTCKVSLSGDFEQYREDVESISVLFKLYDKAVVPCSAVACTAWNDTRAGCRFLLGE